MFVTYLKSKQNPEGYWAQPSYPALTALAVTAYMRDPANQGKPVPEYIRKGYDFILKSQKEAGVGERSAGELQTRGIAEM